MSYEIAPFCILVVSGIGVGAILGEIFQLATTPKSSKVSDQQ
jgi:gas vesicle protein